MIKNCLNWQSILLTNVRSTPAIKKCCVCPLHVHSRPCKARKKISSGIELISTLASSGSIQLNFGPQIHVIH